MAYPVPYVYYSIKKEPKEHFPRPNSPRELAQWELDVVDGTLVPEFHEVHVGWKTQPVYEQVEVSTFGEYKAKLIDGGMTYYPPPEDAIFEERLFWVRNPDLPKANRSIGTELVRR